MLCSLAWSNRPYTTFLSVASQLGREDVRVAINRPGAYAHLRRLPSHGRSPFRSCLRLVLLLQRWSIETVVFPAMGAGFGGVPYLEVARQMAVAYRHYLNPPHRMDWDMVAGRQRAIHYDGKRQVSR